MMEPGHANQKANQDKWFGPHRTDLQKHTFLEMSTRLGIVLQMALHMSGGPGARMTEECAWLVCNSKAIGDRNIRFVRNAIVVMNTYSKSIKQKEKHGSMVVTFADEKLSQLVVAYLTLVKRIETYDVHVLLKRVPNCVENSTLYFCIKRGRHLDGDKFGAMFRAKLANFGINIHVSDLRHVLEGYARQIGCHLASIFEQNPLLQTANHDVSTSSMLYALSNHDLNGVAADVLCCCAQYSKIWNKTLLSKESSPMLVRPWDRGVGMVDEQPKHTFRYLGSDKEVSLRRPSILRQFNMTGFKSEMQKEAYEFFELRQEKAVDKGKRHMSGYLAIFLFR